MIHTFIGDFTNLFELIATLGIGLPPLWLFLQLWYDDWKEKKQEANKNKKAS